MVRTYWFFPVFNEASGNLDLQPFARRPNRSLSSPCYVCTDSSSALPVRDLPGRLPAAPSLELPRTG